MRTEFRRHTSYAAASDSVPTRLKRTERRDWLLADRSRVTAAKQQCDGDHKPCAARNGVSLHDSPILGSGDYATAAAKWERAPLKGPVDY